MTAEPPEESAGVVRRFVDAWPDMAAAAATGAADWAITGTPSIGIGAPALALLLRFADDARAGRERRGSQLVDQAATEVGGLDELERLATSDQARLELTARTIEAAMRTTLEEKIRALAHALANGLLGHATVDQTQLLLAALNDIEAPHVQVLAELRDRIEENAEQVEAEIHSANRLPLITLTPAGRGRARASPTATSRRVAERTGSHRPGPGRGTVVLRPRGRRSALRRPAARRPGVPWRSTGPRSARH